MARTCGTTPFAAAEPLTVDERLQAAAQRHSEDMDANEFMGHVGSDGSGVGERATREGYTWSWIGENVAAGYTTPEGVMAAWLASPGHCSNVMRPEFVDLGVGRAGYSWTQVFARPR